MKKGTAGKNFFAGLYRRLLEARWFFAATASLFATITGITLTFGINSCRETRRVHREMQKSMLQAVGNLEERFNDAEEWVDIIEAQNRIYTIADSLYVDGTRLPDSICEEFRYTMPYIRLASYDHDFEKIFRGSYQLWQVQNSGDSLVYYISQCYDGLNIVESTCEELTESMLETIGAVNESRKFYRMSPREWTMTLLSDPSFQYYMSVRRVKANIISDIFSQARTDYDTNVVSRSTRLRE